MLSSNDLNKFYDRSDFKNILDYTDAQKDSISNTFSILDTTTYVEDVSIKTSKNASC